MKNMLLITATCLLALPAFANLDACDNVMGSFTCSADELKVPLEVNKKSNVDLEIIIAGDTQNIIVDGTKRGSDSDDSEYTASCTAEKGIQIINTFMNIEQTISISATTDGVLYKIDKKGGGIELNCVRQTTTSR